MAQPLVSLRAIVLLLACAAGCVEAVLYLGLGVFTAAMTGHTVLLGIAIAQANVVAIMRLIPALLGYLTGVAIGGVVIDRGRDDVGWSENQLGFKEVKWIKAIEFVEDYRDRFAGEGGYNEDHEFYGYKAEI